MIYALMLWEPLQWVMNVAQALWQNHRAELSVLGIGALVLALVLVIDADNSR